MARLNDVDDWRDFSSVASLYETQYNAHTGAFRHRRQRMRNLSEKAGLFYNLEGIGPWIGGAPPDRPALLKIERDRRDAKGCNDK